MKGENEFRQEFIKQAKIFILMFRNVPRNKNGDAVADIAKVENVGFFYVFLN